MREVKHYICDICHTEYADRDKAIACEKSHKLITGWLRQFQGIGISRQSQDNDVGWL